MVRPESALSDFQALLMEKPRLSIIAAIMKQVGKIVHRSKGVDVLSSKHSLSLCQAPAKQVFRGRVVSLVLKRKRLILHRLCAQRGGRGSGLLRLFAQNKHGNEDAQDDTNGHHTKSPQAPSQWTGPLCLAGYLLGGIDGRNLAGRVAGKPERTLGDC